MKKVLIVEDKPIFQKLYQKGLQGKVAVLAAVSIEEAERIFLENPDIDIIVMDGILHDGYGADLTKKFRQTFKGPIIAAASTTAIQEGLLSSGCNYEADWKDDVPDLILQILGF